MSRSRATNILKLRCWLFTSCNTFFKKGLELVSLSLHNSWIKIFLTLYSVNWPTFTVWLRLILEILDNIVVLGNVGQLFVFQLVTLQHLKLTLAFIWSGFFYMTCKNIRSFIQVNKINFFGRREFDFKAFTARRPLIFFTPTRLRNFVLKAWFSENKKISHQSDLLKKSATNFLQNFETNLRASLTN